MKKITKFALVLAAWVTVSAPSWGFFSFISDAQFCLVQCKADFCASSQENFDACQHRCKGRYQGVIKNCSQAALAQGYAPIMLAAASEGDEEEEPKHKKRKKSEEDGETEPLSPEDDGDEDDAPRVKKHKKKHNKHKKPGEGDEGSENPEGGDEDI